jgi:hypothetical protein
MAPFFKIYGKKCTQNCSRKLSLYMRVSLPGAFQWLLLARGNIKMGDSGEKKID